MLKFLNLEPEIFGIEINDLFIRIAKIKKKRKSFSLVSFTEVNIKPGLVKEGVIQDEDALAVNIKLACKNIIGEKLNTKYIITSLPEEKSFSQIIQMPKMTKEELKLAVPLEAENYIPLTISDTYLDFQIIDSHDKNDINHLDLLINVVPRPIIDSYVSCFKKSGLVPCILEIESQAIARALIKNGQETSPLLLIDFGLTSTGFIIFSDNSVRFTSSVSVSSNKLTNAISDKLKINLDKAEELKIKYGLTKEGEEKYNITGIIKPVLMDLITEIKKYINFYNSHTTHDYLLSSEKFDKKIKKIIICGGGANLKMFQEFLFNELKIKIEIGNPLINISEYNKKGIEMISKNKALSLTTVLGLALRGANRENQKFQI